MAQIKDACFMAVRSRNQVDAKVIEAAPRLVAIDVFPVEPYSNDDEFLSPLRGLDQSILTPQIGGSTEEAYENIGGEVEEKPPCYSYTGTTAWAANFLEVALLAHVSKHRSLYVYQNITGVMSPINQVFSENNGNVGDQYLQTMGDTGCVVIDVEAVYLKALFTRLTAIEGTL